MLTKGYSSTLFKGREINVACGINSEGSKKLDLGLFELKAHSKIPEPKNAEQLSVIGSGFNVRTLLVCILELDG